MNEAHGWGFKFSASQRLTISPTCEQEARSLVTTTSSSMNLAMLQSMVHRVEPSALMIEPRILRRIIRLDQRLPGLGPSVPHQHSYVIERDRLLAFVDRFELEMRPGMDLART